MKTKTYTVTFGADEVDELSRKEYDALEAEAKDVFETPAEYAGYTFLHPAKTENGGEIWLGVK